MRPAVLFLQSICCHNEIGEQALEESLAPLVAAVVVTCLPCALPPQDPLSRSRASSNAHIQHLVGRSDVAQLALLDQGHVQPH